MFDAIAHRYDLLNRILSFGQDLSWRRRAIRLAASGTVRAALDVGAGTGDLALALAGAEVRTVVALDLSAGMLERARGRGRVALVVGSAEALPFPDASFDAVVAGFAVRNFGDLGRGLAQMRRVLRPSGRAVILELSLPPVPLVRALHLLYLYRIGPVVARLAGSTEEAYRYLPGSIERFPDPDRFAAMLRDVGFARVRYERLTFGVATVHVAET